LTDASQTKTKAGAGLVKVGLGGFYFDFCQHVTPPLAGYLNMLCPWMGVDFAFETVVAGQSIVAMAALKMTPNYIVDSFAEGIMWWRLAWQKLAGAFKKPLDRSNP
jgi:hypothetical protein